ncbi:envelope stress response membrane protein PspC [Pragia fontium]|uniref:Phage shock protein C (PspC) family protein n=2 Tax=Pragia fontium TaxID=82985 RepID=A0AAJ5BHG4_9GAMM|nr:envelope stress response membrane protein PspC [Pragia fontium]AKJ42265.1 transcriptional regulator [Pragia fontium]SFC95435.1 phage shock protein C (PspC) family protein [Pragia fontium DSM 5563 = ATCC 49100]SUB82536.1 Phage shock protein C [Pragia fontium]VEJ55437.1 Phage shock protein C [Pragia fontium]GKX61666.1 DNA-binding transcriptional activator PspC [Pragia fontium]
MNNKLYRIPDEGMISGVCAGIARYLGIPVLMVRILAILALFFGFFFITVVVYFTMVFFLESAPAEEASLHSRIPARQRIKQVEQDLLASEQRLRDLERYLTSETFQVESRFRRL